MVTRVGQNGGRTRRGFSLVEVLLAVFILGIGLIMVACIFPVGADWSRQNLEETVSGIVARNAVAIVQSRIQLPKMTWLPTTAYAAGDNVVYKGQLYTSQQGGNVGHFPPDPTQPSATPASNTYWKQVYVVSLSNLQTLGTTPMQLGLQERAYAFGTSLPYPAANPATAGYFWTGVVRGTGCNGQLDLYVFVMKKGSAEQRFGSAFPMSGEFGGSRLAADDLTGSNLPVLVPYLKQDATVSASVPPIGSQGLGMWSGTSFRQLPGPSQKPVIIPGEPVLWVPPADGTNTSPLVYIYQTAITY